MQLLIADEFDTSDGWDWEWFKYGGTVILKRTEEAFWKLTPREFDALIRIHIYINSPKKNKNKPTGFIDSVL